MLFFSTVLKKGEGLIQINTYSIFAEKLVPVIVDIFLQAPLEEKYNVFPDVIQSLGR